MTQYIVVYTLGFGDTTRCKKLAVAFKDTLVEAIGRQPIPLMISFTGDAQVWSVTADVTANDLYGAIEKRFSAKGARLSGTLTNPDRLAIFEVGETGVVASDAAVKAALSIGR